MDRIVISMDRLKMKFTIAVSEVGSSSENMSCQTTHNRVPTLLLNQPVKFQFCSCRKSTDMLAHISHAILLQVKSNEIKMGRHTLTQQLHICHTSRDFKHVRKSDNRDA